jgi:hypothetical protein
MSTALAWPEHANPLCSLAFSKQGGLSRLLVVGKASIHLARYSISSNCVRASGQQILLIF